MAKKKFGFGLSNPANAKLQEIRRTPHTGNELENGLNPASNQSLAQRIVLRLRETNVICALVSSDLLEIAQNDACIVCRALPVVHGQAAVHQHMRDARGIATGMPRRAAISDRGPQIMPIG